MPWRRKPRVLHPRRKLAYDAGKLLSVLMMLTGLCAAVYFTVLLHKYSFAFPDYAIPCEWDQIFNEEVDRLESENNARVSFVHVVNAYYREPGSSGHHEMMLVNEALSRALQWAKRHAIPVELIFVGLEEDRAAAIPEAKFVPLHRTILDIPSVAAALERDPTQLKLKFPFARDLLNAAKRSRMSHVVLSNPDIIIGEDFYTRAARDQNMHGFNTPYSYTRRVVNEKDLAPGANFTLDDVYAVKGSAHPGHDCFVFPRELLGYIDMRDLIVGAARWGHRLLVQLSRGVKARGRPRTATKTLLVNRQRTWHLYQDNEWRNDYRQIYEQWNTFQDLFIMWDYIKDSVKCKQMTKLLSNHYEPPEWLEELYGQYAQDLGDVMAQHRARWEQLGCQAKMDAAHSSHAHSNSSSSSGNSSSSTAPDASSSTSASVGGMESSGSGASIETSEGGYFWSPGFFPRSDHHNYMSSQAAHFLKLGALGFLVGGAMEGIMITTGFYDIVIRKKAEERAEFRARIDELGEGGAIELLKSRLDDMHKGELVDETQTKYGYIEEVHGPDALAKAGPVKTES